MSHYWRIVNHSKHPVGYNLDDLQIQETSTGYQLVAVLCEAGKLSPPEFKNIPYHGEIWTIQVTESLLPHEDSKGSWSTQGSPTLTNTDPQSGDFTAQAGSSEEEPGKAASSANA